MRHEVRDRIKKVVDWRAMKRTHFVVAILKVLKKTD